MHSFTPLIATHAVAALTAILLGPVQILRPRRDRAHRFLGRTWVLVMVTTCVTSFFIRPDGFTWLHGLAIFTLGSVTMALVGIRRGNVGTHRRNMIGSYVGTLAAFAFATLVPTRLIQTTLHQSPSTILVATAIVLGATALWSTGIITTVGRREPVRQ